MISKLAKLIEKLQIRPLYFGRNITPVSFMQNHFHKKKNLTIYFESLEGKVELYEQYKKNCENGVAYMEKILKEKRFILNDLYQFDDYPDHAGLVEKFNVDGTVSCLDDKFAKLQEWKDDMEPSIEDCRNSIAGNGPLVDDSSALVHIIEGQIKEIGSKIREMSVLVENIHRVTAGVQRSVRAIETYVKERQTLLCNLTRGDEIDVTGRLPVTRIPLFVGENFTFQ